MIPLPTQNTSPRSGFTLVEMLVVIVIISLLASAIAIGVRAAQSQAYDTLCRAHLKNLHNAATSYLADKEYYPPAGSYEVSYEDTNSDGTGPNGGLLTFSERVGWVAWIRDGVNKTSANNPYNLEKHKTHAEVFRYVGCGGSANRESLSGDKDLESAKAVQQSIREGALFKYTGKDFSTYVCKLAFENGGARRSYAMNGWFYSRRHPTRELRDTATLSHVDASRLAMFVEVAVNKGAKVTGEPHDLTKDADYYQSLQNKTDDSVWDYDDDAKEDLGCWHKIAGENCTHILFADGHIETVPADEDGHLNGTIHLEGGHESGDEEDGDFLERIRRGVR